MNYLISQAIEQGRRDYQQDAIYVDKDYEGGLLALVCDGLGGHADGDFASSETVKIFTENFRSFLRETDRKLSCTTPLVKCVNFTHSLFMKRVHEEKKGLSSATTLVACYIRNNHASFVSVGDSLIYVIEQGTRRRLAENTKHESASGYLISHIGAHGLAHIWSADIELKKNDVIILASDGLEYLLDISKPIAEHIEDAPPSEIAQYLVKETLSIQHAHQDNIAVVAINLI